MKNFLLLLFVALTTQHVFGIGGKPILCVPESDLNPDLLVYNDESTHLTPGNGHTPGFTTFFSLAEMQRLFGTAYYSNPTFGKNPALTGLSATVSFLSDQDQRRLGPAMRARDIGDIWHSTGACPNATVQPLATGVYIARCSADANYGSLWNRDRDPRIDMPSAHTFVLATCDYEVIALGPYQGSERRECHRVLIFDGFMIDYQFAEQNAGLMDRLDTFLEKKIGEWKRNCSTAT